MTTRREFDRATMCGAKRRSDDVAGLVRSHPERGNGLVQRAGGGKGQPCRQYTGAGTDHPGSGLCKLHGGSVPNAAIAAAEERAAKALEGLGQPIATDPQRALMQMVAWSAGRIQAIVHQHGKALEKHDAGLAAVLLGEFGDERDRMMRVAKVTIDADIAERQSKINEEIGRALAAAIVAGLDAAGVTGPKRKAAVQAAVNSLHQLDAQVPVGVGNN